MLFELNQLIFDHLVLLVFFLFLDAGFVLLCGSQLRLQLVLVVCVAAEDPLVVHDVQSFALLELWVVIKTGSVGVLGLGLVLGLVSHDLGLSAFESLTHEKFKFKFKSAL